MALSTITINAKTNDLEGGYYPVAGADVFLLNMSARTDEDGYVSFVSDLPDYGACASVHRIGYKPSFIYLQYISNKEIEMSANFEVASVERVAEIFTDFQTSLPGSKNTVNWDIMTGTVQNYVDYVVIDPTNRYYDAGNDCCNLLSDFCSKRNNTYQETASSGATSDNPIDFWRQISVDISTDLDFYGYLPELSVSAYSATNTTYIGMLTSIGDDFIIGLPCFHYEIFNALDKGLEYYFVISGASGQMFESEHGTISDSDENNVFHKINEMRITGTTIDTEFQVYFIQNAVGTRPNQSQPSQTLPNSRLLIPTTNLYLFNTPTDYWSCYDNQFSTDGYNHYNGPFGPVYH